jgi:hypothetical protein
MGPPRGYISSIEQSGRIRIEGVNQVQWSSGVVQLEVKIVPVECPVRKDDSVSDSDL